MKNLISSYLALSLSAALGCGPAFTVDPKYLDGYDAGELLHVETALDAGDAFARGDASDAGEIRQDASDAGELLEETSTPVPVDAGTPVRDAGEVLDAEQLDAGDAGDAQDAHVVMIDAGPPPPKPLCCATGCSGPQIADITCQPSNPWTCGAGNCTTAGACGAGATCHWMGATCTGVVEVCP